jgi:hypothetical protein
VLHNLITFRMLIVIERTTFCNEIFKKFLQELFVGQKPDLKIKSDPYKLFINWTLLDHVTN